MTDSHDNLIRTEFARQADTLARGAVFNDAVILERIRQAARLGKHSRALDVACGPGIVVEALARDAGAVVGCDITPEMLAKAEQRSASAALSNVRFVPGRAESLPFEDAEFDVVVSRSALHHFLDPAATIREMARVLKPGGRMVTVDVMASEDTAEAALHNALEILRDPSHVRMLPRSELQKHLENAGLRVESCATWVNHREAGEWLKITNAPERVGPLKVVMSELATRGASAGIDLRVDGGRILFEHKAGLTLAVKEGKPAADTF
jgi:ubiquinone/menaquinone biosynthesis C-methylase UbiE